MYVIQHGASESLGPGVRSVEEENRRVAFFGRMPLSGCQTAYASTRPPGNSVTIPEISHEGFSSHGLRRILRAETLK